MTAFDNFHIVSKARSASLQAQRRSCGPFRRTLVSRAPKATDLRARYELAVLRLRAAYAAFDQQKAGFNEDQPRWPKGSGENSGRWSGGAGAGGTTERIGVGSRVRAVIIM